MASSEPSSYHFKFFHEKAPKFVPCTKLYAWSEETGIFAFKTSAPDTMFEAIVKFCYLWKISNLKEVTFLLRNKAKNFYSDISRKIVEEKYGKEDLEDSLEEFSEIAEKVLRELDSEETQRKFTLEMQEREKLAEDRVKNCIKENKIAHVVEYAGFHLKPLEKIVQKEKHFPEGLFFPFKMEVPGHFTIDNSSYELVLLGSQLVMGCTGYNYHINIGNHRTNLIPMGTLKTSEWKGSEPKIQVTIGNIRPELNLVDVFRTLYERLESEFIDCSVGIKTARFHELSGYNPHYNEDPSDTEPIRRLYLAWYCILMAKHEKFNEFLKKLKDKAKDNPFVYEMITIGSPLGFVIRIIMTNKGSFRSLSFKKKEEGMEHSQEKAPAMEKDN